MVTSIIITFAILIFQSYILPTLINKDSKLHSISSASQTLPFFYSLCDIKINKSRSNFNANFLSKLCFSYSCLCNVKYNCDINLNYRGVKTILYNSNEDDGEKDKNLPESIGTELWRSYLETDVKKRRERLINSNKKKENLDHQKSKFYVDLPRNHPFNYMERRGGKKGCGLGRPKSIYLKQRRWRKAQQYLIQPTPIKSIDEETLEYDKKIHQSMSMEGRVFNGNCVCLPYIFTMTRAALLSGGKNIIAIQIPYLKSHNESFVPSTLSQRYINILSTNGMDEGKFENTNDIYRSNKCFMESDEKSLNSTKSRRFFSSRKNNEMSNYGINKNGSLENIKASVMYGPANQYIILITGETPQKIFRIAGDVESRMIMEWDVSCHGVDGLYRNSDLISMDYHNIIVNVLSEQMRQKLNLERFYSYAVFMLFKDSKEYGKLNKFQDEKMSFSTDEGRINLDYGSNARQSYNDFGWNLDEDDGK